MCLSLCCAMHLIETTEDYFCNSILLIQYNTIFPNFLIFWRKVRVLIDNLCNAELSFSGGNQ